MKKIILIFSLCRQGLQDRYLLMKNSQVTPMYIFNKNIAFSSARQLFFVMGHEFVHVSQIAALSGEAISLWSNLEFRNMLDLHAYSFEYNVLKSGNSGGFTNADAARLMKSFPNFYHKLHYTNFPSIFNHSFRFPF